MKRFLLFALAVIVFAACSKDAINEQQNMQTIVDEAPETLVVGFEEGDDTRIQLNEEQKTVWTKGDLVSVFYKSDANQKYEYRGETGERTAELHKVSAGSSTTKMGYVVVAYPYNEEYIISPASGNLETMLPTVQHYAVDSYGVGDNLMVSCSEFTQFSLKSVCGWLKLQLTGNGEVVKGIKFRGNNGEQVAGLIHVDTKSAEVTLYSEEVAPDDNGNANGNLVIDGAMTTEVMLYCDEGVTLSSETTAFYIALPPQTFEEGFTVDVICTDGTMMTKSSDKKLSIERNHIQPMAAFEFTATGTTDVPTEPENPVNPNLPLNENNKIYYTTTDGKKMFPYKSDGATFGAILISNIYKDGVGVMTFDDDVTMIGDEAFDNCDKLTSVTLPDSVTSIGKEAFYNCDGFTEFTIPNSVTTIGSSAFYDCDSLTSVTIPDSVTTIGGSAFYSCYSLTSVTIGDSVTTIGDAAFSCCDSLTSVTIPNSVTTIGDYAFEYCDSLTSVTIGNSVTVESVVDVFRYCRSLQEFKGKFASKDGRCLIDDGILYYVAPGGLTEYTIPDSVTLIRSCAFENCDSLTSVNIPDSVTTIGGSAFYDCDSLTSVTIPDSVTSIGNEAFYSCDSLTNVNIGDSVTTIGNSAFFECTSLTSVTIGSVTTIGSSAFYECTSLTSVTIGSVTTIGSSAFYECDSLTSVNIGDSVTTIGAAAFFGCDSLTSVTIPDSVTTIGDEAFIYCYSLTSVYCYATIPPSLGGAVFYNNASGQRIYVYEECVEVYKSAWSGYKDSIYTNGQNCPETTTIEYTTNDGNIVTTQNMPVLSNIYDNGVGTLVVVGKISHIPNKAFRDCTSLTSVTIPDSVTTIGTYAFSNCDSLTSVNIPDSVTTIGKSAFEDCDSLTSVTIGDSVTSIGDYAFSECDSLTSVNIPYSVTTIGFQAFRDCTSLTSVTIGDSVTSIGNYAFYECHSLTSVYCKATTPPALGGTYVFDYNASGRKIYVPVGSVNAYKSATNWSEYKSDIVGYDFENGVVVE